ncbi:MAG: helix-turn-helix domain-containing protein, partial [Thermodesulforhabdaceae bacterium]
EIGQYLRQRREEKGISLIYISEVTKISPQLLRAIEEGRWEKLYSSFFLVNFLKAYCKVIGEPYEEPVKIAEHYFLPFDRKRAENYKKILTVRAPLFRNRSKVLFYISVVCVSILMLVGGLFISNKVNKPINNQMVGKEEVAPEVPQEVVKALKIQKDEPSSTSTEQGSTTSQSSGQESERIPPSSSTVPDIVAQSNVKNAVEAGISPNVHRLVIEAIDETWVKVWIDSEGTAVNRLMTEGERIEFEVKDRAKVKLGNAAGARIIWDDKVLENLGRKGRVITLTLPRNSKSLKKNVP